MTFSPFHPIVKAAVQKLDLPVTPTSYAKLKAARSLRHGTRRQYNSSMPMPAKKKVSKTAAVRKVTRKKVWRRKPSEFNRIYGSRARVRWVKSQCCYVCSDVPCENAHYVTGGMGRKAGYKTIVPLCAPHHRMLHRMGITSFEAYRMTNLSALAAICEREWREHLARHTPEKPSRKKGRNVKAISHPTRRHGR